MTDVNLRYLIGVVAVVGLIVLLLRNPQEDTVRWTRRTFEALASGRASVQPRIAWEALQAVGVDVGATYTKLPNAREQAQYRQAFLRELAAGFRQAGARPEAFVNWRIAEKSAEAAEMSAEGAEKSGRMTVVAADYPDKQKTLLITLTAGKPRQVVGIQWSTAENADEER